MTDLQCVSLALYALCALWQMGFQLAKADSIFAEDDWVFWAVAIIASLTGPIGVAVTLGYSKAKE